ncbi:hypothetical protein IFT62_24395 [Pseudomonas lutea]|uniref:Uncharacterized protein n=1 Tax=Pseudomonas lutea TaxID=243924 RepID=A0ABR9AE98_9PSED|nr:hypothetical protein [Pseudomonas lutea]MBD8124351.1 hypothetical protein [Pseudomonas lutea]
MQNLIQENDALLLELHNTQEDLERAVKAVDALETQLTAVTARLNRMCDAYPRHVDVGQVSVRGRRYDENRTTSDWLLQELAVDPSRIETVHVSFDTKPGNEQLKFPRLVDNLEVNSWIDWSSISDPADELAISKHLPIFDCRSGKPGKYLNASEWGTLRKILDAITQLLQQSSDLNGLPANMKKAHVAAIKILMNAAMSWPIMLRYDHWDLIGVDLRSNYMGLKLKVSNAAINARHIPELVFTFATVDEGETSIGSYPRLEFAEESRHYLESWFPETADHRGARWELRFATPNEMDMKVWNTLSGEDQVFMTAIIAELPIAVAGVVSNNSSFKNHRKEWVNIADSMRNIARQHLT